MKKICLTLLAFVFIFTPVVNAASLSLTKIGALDTSGKTYSEWWYTGTKPVLQGTADAQDSVTIQIGETTREVTADASGNWSFYSEDLTEGDHSLVLTSGDQTYAFTLHLGQSLPQSTSETTQSTVAVPETGIPQLFGLVGGVSALAAGWYLYAKRSRGAFSI